MISPNGDVLENSSDKTSEHLLRMHCVVSPSAIRESCLWTLTLDTLGLFWYSLLQFMCSPSSNQTIYVASHLNTVKYQMISSSYQCNGWTFSAQKNFSRKLSKARGISGDFFLHDVQFSTRISSSNCWVRQRLMRSPRSFLPSSSGGEAERNFWVSR